MILDYQSSTPPAVGAPWRVWVWRGALVVLTLLGLALYLFGDRIWGGTATLKFPDWKARARDAAIVLVAAVLCVPRAVHGPVANWLDRVRRPSPAARRWATLVIAVVAASYCWLTAESQGRDLALRTQDEMMYLVQTQHVAHGHLYLPAHPKAEFFQTFYIFVRPVYAGMYFPGAAVMFAPMVWLHVAPWAWMLLIAGGVAGMTFRVVAELVDAVAGALAAALLLSLVGFRTLSVMTMSYLPMALLALLVLWAYLRWRRERRWRWAAVVGALLGWAAITRPLDAVCFGLPLGLAILWDLRGAGWRRGAMTVAIMAACTAPFLSLQLIANRGITGDWLTTPVQKYYKTFWPGVEMGLNPRELPGGAPVPDWAPPQFKTNYDDFLIPMIRNYAQARGPGLRYVQTIGWGLPNLILAPLLLVGLLGLRDVRRLAWAAGLVLFPAAYVMFVYSQFYPVVLAPGLLFLVVLGAAEVARAMGRAGRFAGAWLVVALAALAITGTPEVTGEKDRPDGSRVMAAFNDVAGQIRRPAVVFFRYRAKPYHLWRHEQTHNFETAQIDDAPLIRAQWLGDRNIELIRYYAERQPRRTIYVFDQGTLKLTRLGTASDLAKPPPSPQADAETGGS